jgi:gamma-glutamyl:cysteine ligase YbdK (ATP-grasp superfamily)
MKIFTQIISYCYNSLGLYTKEKLKRIKSRIRSSSPQYGLFEVVGIEMEYIIADDQTLDVKPVSDLLLAKLAGKYVSHFENGAIAYSNELVKHVIELKTNGPAKNPKSVVPEFHRHVVKINDLLKDHNALLMPTGAHPWMYPQTETKLWDQGNRSVYELYNTIFNCSGHGWSNLQSTHVNLPFKNNKEFGSLHAAIRLLLPILPALSASSPIFEGHPTGFRCTRLEAYRKNQKKIPSITGIVIPEAVFSEKAYYKKIYTPIMRDIAPYDPNQILEHHYLNSRGAIARFDRGTIEIRVLDIQECPKADLAIVEAILATLKWIIKEIPLAQQKKWDEKELAVIFNDCIRNAERSIITDQKYIKLFGIHENKISANELWKTLLSRIKPDMDPELYSVFEQIVTHGTLSTRIMRHLNGDSSKANIFKTYQQLVLCLQTNQLFNCN